jgi:hypothetical protein
MLWMDDDAVFTDMEFVFPFADYDAAGVNLVIWGDPQRVYRANDIQARGSMRGSMRGSVAACVAACVIPCGVSTHVLPTTV